MRLVPSGRPLRRVHKMAYYLFYWVFYYTLYCVFIFSLSCIFPINGLLLLGTRMRLGSRMFSAGNVSSPSSTGLFYSQESPEPISYEISWVTELLNKNSHTQRPDESLTELKTSTTSSTEVNESDMSTSDSSSSTIVLVKSITLLLSLLGSLFTAAYFLFPDGSFEYHSNTGQ